MGSVRTSLQDFGELCLSAHKVTTPLMSPWSQTYICNQLGVPAIYAFRKKDQNRFWKALVQALRLIDGETEAERVGPYPISHSSL